MSAMCLEHENLVSHRGENFPLRKNSVARMILLLLAILFSANGTHAQSYRLIAHRGGVVDSLRKENTLPALNEAINQRYWMTEIDLRLTKDGVFILQHEKTLKHFGVDKPVTTMSWNEISQLKNDQGSKIMTLEEALQACSNKMHVMIDNKIEGNDTVMFSRVVRMLKKYGLQKEAMMIGTDESTDFFTGKIKLSCTRQQLEDNKKKSGFKPDNYYLFGGTDSMTADDVAWADKESIMVVGVVNKFRYRDVKNLHEAVAADVLKLKSWGVRNFQIDSEFSEYFKK